MSAHAKLSPSSAERWISCPASVRMAAALPHDDLVSDYALEGTAFHELAWIRGSVRYGLIDEDTAAKAMFDWEEHHEAYLKDDRFEEHLDAWFALLDARLAELPNSKILLEQRMQTGIDQCWGTSDAVIVSASVVEIWDIKYGQGLFVSASGNPQLRLYALGALDTFGDLLGETERVVCGVYQPRLSNVAHEEISANELREWREQIRPIAAEALGPNAHFGPSEKACWYCPARGQCRAQLEAATAHDFGRDPDLLDPEEIADAMDQLGGIKSWVAALEATALNLAYSEGVAIPRYKVVLSGGRRVVTDQESALAALYQAGYKSDQVAKLSILGIGQLEKLLGKDDFATILGDYVQKTEGKPSLVPEDDKRPAVSPDTEAQKEFGTDE